jgi:hypothetical protein
VQRKVLLCASIQVTLVDECNGTFKATSGALLAHGLSTPDEWCDRECVWSVQAKTTSNVSISSNLVQCTGFHRPRGPPKGSETPWLVTLVQSLSHMVKLQDTGCFIYVITATECGKRAANSRLQHTSGVTRHDTHHTSL